MAGSRDDDAEAGARDGAGDGVGDGARDGAGDGARDGAGDGARDGTAGSDGLDAAWGGAADESSSGPLPTEEDAAAAVRAESGADDPEPAWVDRVTVVLVRHKTAFTLAVLAYGLLVMPWLYQNGYEGIGLAGGLLFLGGIVLVTVANAHAARQHVENVNERRGF